jgi:DNA-binding GntR family transcriptional regulator
MEVAIKARRSRRGNADGVASRPASSRGRLTNLAYQALNHKIITLEFSPGMKLEERDLIERLGLGRTPIREALTMLVSDGLVVSHGPNAVYVKELTLKSVKDLWELLYQFGSVIFNLAKPESVTEDIIVQLQDLHRKMDEAIVSRHDLPSFLMINGEFHKKLASIANNNYLDQILEQIYRDEVRLSLFCFTQTTNTPEYWAKVQREHSNLIELLRQHDFKALHTAYSQHFAAGIQRVVNFLGGT